MREILFRGKRCDNGEWVECGSIVRGLLDDDKSHYCYYIGSTMRGTWYLNQQGNITAAETHEECIFYEVDPKTVGQFTGLTDKNGAKIFEGDIVRYETYEPYYDRSYASVDTVEFISGQFLPRPHCQTCEDDYYTEEYRNFEVIGNIHDNPELLEQA